MPSDNRHANEQNAMTQETPTPLADALKARSVYGEGSLSDQAIKLLEQTERRLQEAERDAKRYRWLRRQVTDDYGECRFTHRWQCALGGGGSLEATLEIRRAALDDSIDAALSHPLGGKT